MPLLGFGTYRMRGEPAYQAVLTALRAGYRHLDTAQLYGNEADVGRALADSGIPRREVFITTKYAQYHPGKERAALTRSLQRLGIEQVDLWLMHFPLKHAYEHVTAWREFLAAAEDELAASVGVSNHSIAELDFLGHVSGRMPDVNQVRFNPARYDPDLLHEHRQRGVAVEAHSPLREPGLDHPILVEIAHSHQSTPAQVVIAWHLQHGIAVIPKSAHPDRIVSNLAVASLHLTLEEMTCIDGLQRSRIAPNVQRP